MQAAALEAEIAEKKERLMQEKLERRHRLQRKKQQLQEQQVTPVLLVD